MPLPPYPPQLSAGDENRINSVSARLSRLKDQAGELRHQPEKKSASSLRPLNWSGSREESRPSSRVDPALCLPSCSPVHLAGRAYEYTVSGESSVGESWDGRSVSGNGSFADSASIRSRPRPGSGLYLPRRKGWSRRRRWCGNLTRLEMFLFVVTLLLLGGLLGTLSAWFVMSKGFAFFASEEERVRLEPATTMRAVTLNMTIPLNPYADDVGICGTAGCGRIAGYFLENGDYDLDPCDDFYEFACGSYPLYHTLSASQFEENTIRAASTSLLNKQRRELSAAVLPEEPHWKRLVKLFYQRCVDEEVLETQGTVDLLRALGEVGGWPALEGEGWNPGRGEDNSTRAYNWEMILGQVTAKFGIDDVILELMIGSDEKNINRSIIIVDQPGLGMGHSSRPLYADGAESLHARNYTQQMLEVAQALGANGSWVATDMADVTRFEVALALASSPDENRRGNQDRMYNIKSLADLHRTYPDIDLHAFIYEAFPKTVIIDNEEIVCLREMGYYRSLQKLMADTDPRVVQNYIAWRIIQHYAMFMPMAARVPIYQFKANLSGIASHSPLERWIECVALATRILPMPTGALYVDKYFAGQPALDKMRDMAEQLRYAFIDELKNVEWMDVGTKNAALEKAYRLTYRVAHPDYFNNATFMELYWADVSITRESPPLQVAMQMKVLLWVEDSSKLRDPLDRDWWYQSPAQVEAYYAPSLHQMIFPAGIMQWPFLSPDVPNYVTYAMAGAIIGHEISHGFDDQGAQYDKNGQLRNWWDKETKDNFKQKTLCIERQYSAIHVRDAGMNIDGKMSLGENIADNAGVKTAFNAYKQWEAQEYYDEPSIPGYQNFTNDQMFFLSYANNWCNVVRPSYARTLLQTDPHAPSKYRALVPLQNFPEFAKAFNCPSGSPMNPQTQCKVW